MDSLSVESDIARQWFGCSVFRKFLLTLLVRLSTMQCIDDLVFPLNSTVPCGLDCIDQLSCWSLFFWLRPNPSKSRWNSSTLDIHNRVIYNSTLCSNLSYRLNNPMYACWGEDGGFATICPGPRIPWQISISTERNYWIFFVDQR
ncbi:unnamed protein product [Protopolystoma xenopodis]|uniref:Uncharacterized protein n=1 Tax=Protopolystoma xenopodis TaxID=117903 RepID=A0A3S5CK36_9PLAT|nr:unnamed protein product [Protopolystoma xenopodis]